MPVNGNTPEALLGRNDSKNPVTTCRGITGSGRPCRRALASSSLKTAPSPPGIGKRNGASSLRGVVAVLEQDGVVQEADFYCWQHKQQAESKLQRAGESTAEFMPVVRERSSIDTFVHRLQIDGLMERDQRPKARERRGRQEVSEDGVVKVPARTSTRDFAAIPPTMSAGHGRSEGNMSYGHQKSQPRSRGRNAAPGKKNDSGFWASLCCMTTDEDDYVEIVRHRRRVEPVSGRYSTPQIAMEQTLPPGRRPQSASVPARRPHAAAHPTPAIRPASEQRRVASHPQTDHLLSLIPQHCSPLTTSALLAELIKPISAADEEGFIYIFWLTPQTKAAPPDFAAQSLLMSPDKRPELARSISDVVTEYSYAGSDSDDEDAEHDDGARERSTSRTGRDKNNRKKKKRTIMLKIGRANNVTRRMTEWQRQCGYQLTLVRWYPYISSTSPSTSLHASSPSPSPRRQQRLYPELPEPSPPPPPAVRKVPCVKRVERLIHLELAEKQVKRHCAACGKEHREWFEVEASREGVRSVDECVRRWTQWAERLEREHG